MLAELANAADLVFVGLDEARALWGTGTVESIRELLPDPATVIVKDGEIGATAHLVGGDSHFEPAPVIEVLEPVGAGDAFAAGYLHALILGRSERERLAAGPRRRGPRPGHDRRRGRGTGGLIRRRRTGPSPRSARRGCPARR